MTIADFTVPEELRYVRNGFLLLGLADLVISFAFVIQFIAVIGLFNMTVSIAMNGMHFVTWVYPITSKWLASPFFVKDAVHMHAIAFIFSVSAMAITAWRGEVFTLRYSIAFTVISAVTIIYSLYVANQERQHWEKVMEVVSTVQKMEKEVDVEKPWKVNQFVDEIVIEDLPFWEKFDQFFLFLQIITAIIFFGINYTVTSLILLELPRLPLFLLLRTISGHHRIKNESPRDSNTGTNWVTVVQIFVIVSVVLEVFAASYRWNYAFATRTRWIRIIWEIQASFTSLFLLISVIYSWKLFAILNFNKYDKPVQQAQKELAAHYETAYALQKEKEKQQAEKKLEKKKQREAMRTEAEKKEDVVIPPQEQV